MDPKNIDRAGKGFLVVAGAAIVAIGKKYGPTIIMPARYTGCHFQRRDFQAIACSRSAPRDAKRKRRAVGT